MAKQTGIIILLLFTLLIAPATAATISTSSDITAYVGQAPKEMNIILNGATTGLSGYDITVSVSNATAATLAAATLPGWATVGDRNGTLPGSSVRMTAADINDNIKPGTGAAVVTLATVAVQALAPGTTTLDITVNSLDDDAGTAINISAINSATITLSGGMRPKASQTFKSLDEGPYLNLIGSFGGENQLNDSTEGVDWLGIKDAAEEPYTTALGSLFFAIVFALPFIMQWLRQGSMAIPSVIGIIGGAFMLAKTPAEYHIAAVLFIALSVLAVVWSVIKDRV